MSPGPPLGGLALLLLAGLGCRLPLLFPLLLGGQASTRPPPGDTSQRSPHRPQTVEPARTHIAVVPAGLLARATCTVISGTSTPRRGQINITYSSKVSRDSHFPAAREACVFDTDELSLVLR